MAWTYDLDTTVPAGSADPKTLDTIIQNHKKAWQERLNVDHYLPLTGTAISDTDAGEHRRVTLRVLGADPTNVANKGFLYTKDVSAKVELHWEDEDGNVVQITDAGVIKMDATDLELANNTYLTATDAAGTGTVDLIKANASDEVIIGAVTELPDTSRLATSADPVEDEEIVCKGYADGLVTKYVSPWANCAVASSYTLTHSLGTTVINVTVQFKDTGNLFGLGINRVYQISSDMKEDTRGNAAVTNITSTQVTLNSGGNYVATTFSTTGTFLTATSGQYRIICW